MTRAERRARRAATLIVAAGLLVGIGGFTKVEATSAQQKALVQHYTNNDPIWRILTTAAVTQDRGRGIYDATFPPSVAALGGTSVTVSGFMTPLEPQGRVHHFVLTRRSTVCPFCPPNAPNEAVEVRLESPLLVTEQEVTVTGRLGLVPASADGLFYILSNARPGRRES